jgi:hypothetical protein
MLSEPVSWAKSEARKVGLLYLRTTGTGYGLPSGRGASLLRQVL